MKPCSPHPLLGLAVGDALGTPFEAKPHYHAKLMAWDGRSYDDSTFHKTKAGDCTDDTGMALALANALIQGKGFGYAGVRKSYLEWYRSCRDNPNSMGGTIRASLEALNLYHETMKQGWLPEPEEIPKHPGIGALGNGTVMRILPLGICYHRYNKPGDVETWIDYANQDARITHRSDLCSYGSMVLAWIAANLMQPTLGSFEAVELAQSGMLSFKKNVMFDEALTRTLSRCERAPNTATNLNVVLSLGLGLPPVVETVCTGLACFLLTKTYESAVELAIRVGGDTDTRAAVTGGLAAIQRPIPKSLLAGLSQQDEILAIESDLLALAQIV